ncbi:probable G-protein coupled receptor 139 [Heterodontus francisci]|uniref:probable G-protein coupled receptor 139 n=1 Tax=Heterodontus francisci TaxID=7792 RepID=UPI00355C27DA
MRKNLFTQWVVKIWNALHENVMEFSSICSILLLYYCTIYKKDCSTHHASFDSTFQTCDLYHLEGHVQQTFAYLIMFILHFGRSTFDKHDILNLAAIAILSRGKCGLSKCITRYLMAMAVADLLVIISDVILKVIGFIYFPLSLLFITPVCSFIIFLSFTTTDASVWLTVAFTFDRFVAICCEKLKTKYCTEKTAAVVIGTVSVLSCLESVPWCFTNAPTFIIDNVPFGCILKPSFHTTPAWAAFETFYRILTPCVPFFLILLLNVLTVRRILAASGARSRLHSCSNGGNRSDSEMENRRKSIILLFSISGSFVLLWVTQVVLIMYQRITNIRTIILPDAVFIAQSTSGMLQLLNSCTNTCIYVFTQRKFREELKNAIKYPLDLIVKIIKP